MILTEYDYDTDIAVPCEEAYNEAKLETARNMLKYDDSLEKIASVTGLSLETVHKLAEEYKKSTKIVFIFLHECPSAGVHITSVLNRKTVLP